MNRVARMDPGQRADLFAETAERLAIPESLIEKDFWVCWVLKQIFSHEPWNGRFLFKGGTSLSKVFHAINRFSEDIDLAVDYAMLGYTGPREPTQPNLSKTKRAQLLSEMLLSCQHYIAREFQPRLAERFEILLGESKSWSLTVDTQDPHIVRFQYPQAIHNQVAYVSPQVILEMGTHAEFIPRDHFVLRSFAATEFPTLFAEPDVKVAALLAKRTFWEKVTLIHAEHHRPPEKVTPGRYSRHYYDLAMLAQSPVKVEALADMGLLARVVQHKVAFYPSAWARYDLAFPGTLRLVPPKSRQDLLKEDYRRMAVMIFGKAPTFDNILATLARLEEEINSAKRLAP